MLLLAATGPSEERRIGAALRLEPGHVPLRFGDPLDLDGHRLHRVLDTLELGGELRWRNHLYRLPVHATPEGASERNADRYERDHEEERKDNVEDLRRDHLERIVLARRLGDDACRPAPSGPPTHDDPVTVYLNTCFPPSLCLCRRLRLTRLLARLGRGLLRIANRLRYRLASLRRQSLRCRWGRRRRLIQGKEGKFGRASVCCLHHMTIT